MSNKKLLVAPKVTDVRLDGIFWDNYNLDVMDALLENNHKAFENTLCPWPTSGALESMRILAGKIKDKEPDGIVWQDSDLFKWYEGVCWYYAQKPDPKWRAVIDEIAEMTAQVQNAEGYYNSFFQAFRGNHGPLVNLRECHELYCMGNIIEAGIAHNVATGNDVLLNVATKMADMLYKKFGPEEGKIRAYDGHQGIEFALVKLYRRTGEKKYLTLAQTFLDNRGIEPYYFIEEWEKRGHLGFWQKYQAQPERGTNCQDHLPVRQQVTAEGHAVRAVYQYTACADLAGENEDKEFEELCLKVWDNITQRRIYITGGVGSRPETEGFGFDYSLPNTCHCESCASIGLIYFAQSMFHYFKDAKYIDVLERTLYNAMLASTSLDGTKFFYINTLERNMATWKEFTHHGARRDHWQGCACCPTNISRFYPTMHTYTYSCDENNLYVNLYAQGEGKFNLGGTDVTVVQKTEYPWDGRVNITINPQAAAQFTVHVRVPAWCKNPSVALNGKAVDLKEVQKGLIAFDRTWKEGDTITLDLPMSAHFVYPNPRIRSDARRIAIERGPVVYCVEEMDNGAELNDIYIDTTAPLEEKFEKDLFGGVVVYSKGERVTDTNFSDQLYSHDEYQPEQVKVTPMTVRFIPYYMWDNRDLGDMIIWVNKK